MSRASINAPPNYGKISSTCSTRMAIPPCALDYRGAVRQHYGLIKWGYAFPDSIPMDISDTHRFRKFQVWRRIGAEQSLVGLPLSPETY